MDLLGGQACRCLVIERDLRVVAEMASELLNYGSPVFFRTETGEFAFDSWGRVWPDRDALPVADQDKDWWQTCRLKGLLVPRVSG